MARTVSLLDRVRIASPCNVPWASMTGDDKVRYCGECKLNVYNIATMTRDNAEAMIREREGQRLCIQLHQRRDGTVITADCPVGLAAARKRLARSLTGLAAVFTAVLSMGFMIAGKAEFAMRLKRYAPFARLTDWLDPPVIVRIGWVCDFSTSTTSAPKPAEGAEFRFSETGILISDEAQCSDSLQDN